MLGQIEGRRKGQQRMRWLDSIIDSMDMLLLLSRLSHVRLSVTPWTVAHQASLSMEFSRQEYWSGLPLPSIGDLTDPKIEPGSPAKSLQMVTAAMKLKDTYSLGEKL